MRLHTAIGPAAALVLWMGISRSGLIDQLLLPTPLAVFRRLVGLLATGAAWQDLLATLLRWVCGLSVGILFGVPLGLLMGISPKVYSALEILVDFFRSIPVMAMFPIFMIFLGVGNGSKIAISAWTTLLYVMINTLYGVRHKNDARRIAARVFRASPWQIFTKVIFPEALPQVFAGMRISVSMSLVLVVASEMVMGTNVGLGKRIFDAGITYNTAEMYATIMIAGGLGYLSNKAFQLCENHIIHWSIE